MFDQKTPALSVGENFFPVKTDELLDNVETHFDLYAKMEPQETKSSLLLYAKSPYKWTKRELQALMSAGVCEFFVEKSQQEAYRRYCRIYKDPPKVDQSLAPRMRIQNIQDVGAHLIELAFLSDLDQGWVRKVDAVAGDVVDCLQEDPTSVRYLQTLAEHDLYTYIHSVGVGALSAAIALQMGEHNREKLKILALGGLLHDVGKKFVPLAVLNKAGPLTQEEWQLMQAHPDQGLKALQSLIVHSEILSMVGLHHEKLDGSGYPNGLLKESLSDEVQIATVADIFNALTTTRCYHTKRTRYEALMFMKHNLKGKLSSEAFNALIYALTQEKEEQFSGGR